nr:EOG090X0C57 [Triops cancriformis]
MTTTITQQTTRNIITLKGSSQIVTEFFNYSVNNILYQRGIYPSETFQPTKEYGIVLYMSTSEDLKKYLNNILPQIQEWIAQGRVNEIVVVLKNATTFEAIERWGFQIKSETNKTTGESGAKTEGEKDLKEIQKEIREVMRQITASVSFLPLLDIACSFDIQVYTASDCDTPSSWKEDSAYHIANPQEVQLRCFSTSLHNVQASVVYKSGA